MNAHTTWTRVCHTSALNYATRKLHWSFQSRYNSRVDEIPIEFYFTFRSRIVAIDYSRAVSSWFAVKTFFAWRVWLASPTTIIACACALAAKNGYAIINIQGWGEAPPPPQKEREKEEKRERREREKERKKERERWWGKGSMYISSRYQYSSLLNYYL